MKQKQEIAFLLDVLCGTTGIRVIPDSLNLNALIRLATLHRVVYQLMRFAQQHPDVFTQEQIILLENHCRQAALRSLSQLHELKQIAVSLQEHTIGFAVIKGPQLARMLYGREALKESVDLDIMLVRQDDMEKVHALLCEQGYQRNNLEGYRPGFSRKLFLLAKREVQYWTPGSDNHIDLHVRPGANAYLTARRFRGFFDELEDFNLEGITVPALPAEKYLVYLCYHGALHQFSRLAWLLDIRAFLRLKGGGLDYPKLLQLARQMGCERPVFLALHLLQEYFGDPMPGPLLKAANRSWLMSFLVKRCRYLIGQEEGYGVSLRGRTGKLVFMMVLIRGMAGRADLLLGILLRMLAGISKG